MDRAQYLHEAYRQLNNPANYSKLDQPIYPETAAEIKNILLDCLKNNIINRKQYDYLCPPDNPRPRKFYILPKIHKPADSWTIPYKIPKGRPIVSDCSSESEKIAEFIDRFLQLKSNLHPSFIKDTPDFLNKIKNLEIPENSLLITCDVSSMFTSIDNNDGMEAIKQKFSDMQNHPYYKPVMELLEISLKKNDFQFNDETYLQTSGTAMGKKFAPSYCNIFMALWEEQILNKNNYQPLVYFRFLDFYDLDTWDWEM